MSDSVQRARKFSLGFAAMISLGAFSSLSNAALFTFDPDGPAGTNGPAAINGLDWSVGNSLGQGRVSITVGSTFQQFYQATLAGVINGSGNTVAPTGLNSAFEITTVGSSTQLVTGISVIGGVTTVTTKLAPVQAANSFYEIWFDSTPDANNLAGTGFNDGTRILLASPSPAQPSSSTYANAVSAGGGPIVETYDDFGANDYPNTNSLTGSGGLIYESAVNTSDPAFFLTALTAMSFNTSLVTPFRQTDPSQLFAGLAGGAAPAVLPNIGAIDGATGPDFQFQADANSTFTPVPEPAIASAAVLWLSGLMLRRRGIARD